MTLTLAFALVALRAGLELRRRRSRGLSGKRELRDRHLRFGKLAVLFAIVGFCGGPLSAWFLRGMTPFETFHSWLGVGVALLFGAAAQQGRLIETGKSRDRSRHGWLGLIGFLVAALASVAGFILLP